VPVPGVILPTNGRHQISPGIRATT